MEIEVKVKTLRIDILVDTYDVGEDFPMAVKIKNDDIFMRWCVDIDIDTGVIKKWSPAGRSVKLFAKVVDTGSYYLLNENDCIIASIEQRYAPNKAIPPADGYGDYIDLEIDVNGKITNWYNNPDVSEFFPPGELKNQYR